jgi:hypothetical protein
MLAIIAPTVFSASPFLTPKSTQTPAFASSSSSTPLPADRFERSTSQAVQLRSGYSEAEMVEKLIERGFSPKEAKHLPGYFDAFGKQAIIDRHRKIIDHLITMPPIEIKNILTTFGLSTPGCMRKLVLLDHDAVALQKRSSPEILLNQVAMQLGDNARAFKSSTHQEHYESVMGALVPFLRVQLPQSDREINTSLTARIVSLLKPTE